MPRHDFDLGNRQKVPEEIHDPNGLLVHIDNEIRLRKLDSAGSYSPIGTYTTGELLVHTWRPGALAELTGFVGYTEEDEDVGDRVFFRLSTDEGTSQLFWSGSEWRVPTSSSEWNSEDEVDAGIGSFPFAGSISFILKLVTGTGASTPVFKAFYIYWEAWYDPSEDIIRSIHQKLVDEVDIHAKLLVNVDNSDEISFSSDTGTPIWEPAEPIQVFKPAADPGLQNNLFSSFDGSIVKLVSAQTGELLVRYRGRLRQAHVSTEADFEREELPAVVINNLTESRVRDFLYPDYEEALRSRSVVRVRTMPARHDYRFQLQCLSQWPLHDKKLGDAVRRAFDTNEFVRSIALDEDFTLTGLEAVNQVNRTSDQVFMRIVLMTVSVWEWMPAFEDVPMVTDIVTRSWLLSQSGLFKEVSDA